MQRVKQRFALRRPQDVTEAGRGIWAPVLRDYRGVIEDYIAIARRRKRDKVALLKLQLNLFHDIAVESENIEYYDEILQKGLIRLAGEPHEHSFSDDERQSFEQDKLGREVLMLVLRDIGDGILWRAVGYNRALLHLLGQNDRGSKLAMDHGQMSTLSEFSELFINPDVSQAIINETTSCVRIGDVVTIFNDGTVELVEVKSGKARGIKRRQRVERQRKRMHSIVTLFECGQTEVMGRQITLSYSDVQPINLLSDIRQLISAAKRKGAEVRRLADHLVVGCIYPNRNGPSVEELMSESKERMVGDWRKQKDIINSHFITDKLDWAPGFTPLSIYPFPPSMCADLLCGHAILFFFINYSEVLRVFERAGWNCVVSVLSAERREDRSDYFCTLKKGGHTVGIPGSDIARIVWEGLLPEALLARIEDSKLPETSISATRLSLPAYRQEERIWR